MRKRGWMFTTVRTLRSLIGAMRTAAQQLDIVFGVLVAIPDRGDENAPIHASTYALTALRSLIGAMRTAPSPPGYPSPTSRCDT